MFIVMFLFYSSQLHPDMIAYQLEPIAAMGTTGRNVAWAYIKENWDAIMKKYGNELFLLSYMLSSTLKTFSTENELQDIERFFANKTDIGSGKQAVKQSILIIKSRISWRKMHTNSLKIWLRSNGFF